MEREVVHKDRRRATQGTETFIDPVTPTRTTLEHLIISCPIVVVSEKLLPFDSTLLPQIARHN